MESRLSEDVTVELDIKSELANCYAKIHTYRALIAAELNRIPQLEKKLYAKCNHVFVRDPSAMSDDLYKWQCTECQLYRTQY